VMPQVDAVASARPLWTVIAAESDRVCVEPIHRSWRYGLNYYSIAPLPDCAAAPRPIHIAQQPGRPPDLQLR